ncbi:hypothetical protein PBT90_03270 [Algoriphagus halophytocola]|uniref:DUF3899 domain-containing protein n=1 Tax=Algoriphagus halophytocola TaxID=2991499 RepID=A0ABY6MJS8_9BACT|nr:MULTISPECIES: hypothetical protein [unclassified Algoriphagus]UZD22449.1 hypothetical protein OM944_17550 [Algoriphagus sp. TR-M5]WBL43709.1 hypothetical protein PBT90_03270 [Algoriphagus sp. TR-M9]
MEIVASFFLILLIYFLGSLAVVQEVIQPRQQLVVDGQPKKKQRISNHPKILFLSFGLALLGSLIALFLFNF